jgi:hypothetical protein
VLEPHTPRLSTPAVLAPAVDPPLVPGQRVRELESGFLVSFRPGAQPVRGSFKSGDDRKLEAMERNRANRVTAGGHRGASQLGFPIEGLSSGDESIHRMIVLGATSLLGPRSRGRKVAGEKIVLWFENYPVLYRCQQKKHLPCHSSWSW